MTALDIAVLLLIGGGALRGFMRGFVMEALSLAALGAAIIALRLFHASVTAVLGAFIHNDGGAALLAFVLILGGVAGIGALIARKAGASTRRSVLGPIDRMLGCGFGAIKGLLIATVAFLAFSIVHQTLYGARAPRPEWMRKARTYPLLAASGIAMSRWLEARRQHGGLLGNGAGVSGDRPDNGAAPGDAAP